MRSPPHCFLAILPTVECLIEGGALMKGRLKEGGLLIEELGYTVNSISRTCKGAKNLFERKIEKEKA